MMAIRNDPIELILDLIKIGAIAIIGFILSKAWLRHIGAIDKVSLITKCTTVIKTSSSIISSEIWFLVFLTILCVAISSWICGYLYSEKKARRNLNQEGKKHE